MNQYTQRPIIILSIIITITSIAYATETTWRHSGFQLYGYDINMSDLNITHATNISSKNIGGVVYADQYATLQDAVNAGAGGLILLGESDYSTTGINITTNNTRLVGLSRSRVGSTGSQISCTGTGNAVQIGNSTNIVYNVVIENVKINDDDNCNYGILAYGNQLKLDDVQTAWFNVGAKFADATGANELRVYDSTFNNNLYEGLYIEQGDVFLDNIVSNNNNIGILIKSPNNRLTGGVQANNLHPWGNNIGVELYNTFDVSIIGLESEDNRNYSVYMVADNSSLWMGRIQFIGGITWGGTSPTGEPYINFVVDNGSSIEGVRIMGMEFDHLQPSFGYYVPNGTVKNVSVTSNSIGGAFGDLYPGSVQFNNLGKSPFGFGNNATPPTAFGQFDTYGNITSGFQCYSGSAGIADWRYVVNGTVGC